jgi:hypothetical protein
MVSGDCIWWCSTWWWVSFGHPGDARVWRGKDIPCPAQLALRLIDTLPARLTRAFRVLILTDTGFGRIGFLFLIKSSTCRGRCANQYEPYIAVFGNANNLIAPSICLIFAINLA